MGLVVVRPLRPVKDRPARLDVDSSRVRDTVGCSVGTFSSTGSGNRRRLAKPTGASRNPRLRRSPQVCENSQTGGNGGTSGYLGRLCSGSSTASGSLFIRYENMFTPALHGQRILPTARTEHGATCGFAYFAHRSVLWCLMVPCMAIASDYNQNKILLAESLPAGSTMQPDVHVTSEQLVGTWLHAHEEDPRDGSGLEVYRPANWPFGPSRGRRGFELRAGGHVVLRDIAAADGTEVRTGSWSIQADNVLLLETNGSVRRMRIKEIAPDALVVCEISGFTGS